MRLAAPSTATVQYPSPPPGVALTGIDGYRRVSAGIGATPFRGVARKSRGVGLLLRTLDAFPSPPLRTYPHLPRICPAMCPAMSRNPARGDPPVTVCPVGNSQTAPAATARYCRELSGTP